MPTLTNSGPSSIYTPGGAPTPPFASTVGERQGFFERGVDSLEEYARREPWAFAGWVFGVGFILGWKLKPW
ncbi:MAG: hypothetical protein U0790_29380 [Isosphaeraceae bacterium]